MPGDPSTAVAPLPVDCVNEVPLKEAPPERAARPEVFPGGLPAGYGLAWGTPAQQCPPDAHRLIICVPCGKPLCIYICVYLWFQISIHQTFARTTITKTVGDASSIF
ncbi:hypothetical protein DP117_04220 [Brasilonema sp. UFV-L1]|nr:hypothetical protein [Brasilonema sp. UFV-L1]